jgi:hydroxyacylglutathione hydrolase
MDIVPQVDEGLGNSAYVVDLGDGGALVVDPDRDPRPYLAELDRRGLTARSVVETHLHADFVSGGRELAVRGAQLLAPAGDELTYAHRPLRDGEELELGGLPLEVIVSPGHAPEHLAYLLRDAGRPVARFTGGTLMAGGVARPDLLSAEQTEPLARAAYRSISQRLLTLPDELAVYPTHGGGSFCSVAGGGGPTTTIARERASNPLLADGPDEDTFVARLLGGLGPYPPYFLELRDLNRAGPAVHGPMPPPLPHLDLETFDAAVAGGAEVVDVRQLGPFAAAHVPGSLSNPWRAQFATWLGWLVGRTRPIVFVADDTVDRHDPGLGGADGRLRASRRRAGRQRRRLAARRPTARHHTAGGRGRCGRTSGPRHPPAERVRRRPRPWRAPRRARRADPTDTVPDASLLVHCGHGERAMTAASLLKRAGHDDVAVLAGGPGELGELEAGAGA